jgi:hypothetical protein
MDNMQGRTEQNKQEFFEYIGISESWFHKILGGFVNTDILKKTDGVWMPKFERN